MLSDQALERVSVAYCRGYRDGYQIVIGKNMEKLRFDFSGLPGASGTKRHAIAATSRASETGYPVFINDNTETGERLFSVQLVSTDYWLNSFTHRGSADRFISRNGLTQIL